MDRNWYRYAQDEVSSDARSREALESTVIARSGANLKLLEGSRRKRAKTTSIEKMYPTQHFADLFHFPASSVRLWCGTGELEARFIKGEWRISERAFMEFLEKEDRKRG